MKSETKILGLILLVTLALVAVGVILLSRSANTPASGDQNKSYQIDYTKGHKIGSDSAQIKLVEFSDYECPACAAAQPTVNEIIASSSGQIQFIYRHFPLPQHTKAPAASNASEAAGEQGKFWEMHDKLFATQDQWVTLSDPTDFFVNLAVGLGLDGNKVRQAILNNTYKDMIQADTNEGFALSIDATPTFFLNNKKLQLNSFTDLKTAVDQAILKATPVQNP